MRYAATEKLEIIRLVEQSSLPVRRTLAQLGISKSTFYAWYKHYLEGGPEALEDRRPAPQRVWNKVPDAVIDRITSYNVCYTKLLRPPLFSRSGMSRSMLQPPAIRVQIGFSRLCQRRTLSSGAMPCSQ